MKKKVKNNIYVKPKKFDLINSFLYFFTTKNSWRTNIKSILKFDNECLVLAKECISELVGVKHPFNHPGRYQFLAITGNDNLNVFEQGQLMKTNIQVNPL